MAKVEISEQLKKDIFKKFKNESHKIFELIYSLKKNPKKGKLLGTVGKTVIKELRYKTFRFYFITNGYLLRVFDAEKLQEIIIRFVRMSNKKDQQKTINEIKQILKKIGEGEF